MHHELKLQSCFFEPAEAGLKTFEIRRNSDRGLSQLWDARLDGLLKPTESGASE